MLPDAADLNRGLKVFLFQRVYSIEKLTAERQRAVDEIGRLFDYYMEHPGSLPEGHEARATKLARHRVTCDYIAGMTDGFFRRTYRQLLG